MITLDAPAKINLYLHVIGQRPDGYHELITRMQKLDLCDRLELALKDEPGIQFSCNDAKLPTDGNNLAVAAAQKLLDLYGCGDRLGVSIRLEKRIPVAAGLGGGSSDAGTVLRALNTMLGVQYTEQELAEIGVKLGADVPFFTVASSSVIASGVGEIMEPVPDLTGYWILLVNPGISVSTRWVFENYALTKDEKNFRLEGFRDADTDLISPACMHNDLEPTTVSRYPVVGEIKQSLLKAGADAAMMSGSGPTVFGLFRSDTYDDHSSGLVEKFTKVYGSRVYATRTYAGA